MAKLTLTTVGSTLTNTAANTINENSDRIEAAIENTLSRNGITPNQMGSDIDMDGNDILNANEADFQKLLLQGVEVTPNSLVNTGAFATAAQGAKADTALQPASIGVTVQGYDADLQAIAGLSTAANQMAYSTGVSTWALTPLTAAGRALLDDADITTQRATLGLGTAAQANTGTSGATVPLLSVANIFSGVQSIDAGVASPLVVARAGSTTNTSITYTTSAGSVFAGTGSGADWGIALSNNISGASIFKVAATTVTLASNMSIVFAGTGAATTRANLGVYQALSGTAVYDPPSLADGVGVTTTVTVTGAALGDVALPSFSLDTQGITITAWVSAANTVSVRFQNETTGVLDLASGTLKAVVLKP